MAFPRFRGARCGGSASGLGVLADVDLLGRVAEGSVDAVGALYDRHAAFLFRLAQGFLGSRAAAERVVRETLLSVWRRPPAELERLCVRTWLSSIAVRLAMELSAADPPADGTTVLPADLSPADRRVLVLAAMGIDHRRLVELLDLPLPPPR